MSGARRRLRWRGSRKVIVYSGLNFERSQAETTTWKQSAEHLRYRQAKEGTCTCIRDLYVLERAAGAIIHSYSVFGEKNLNVEV